MKVILSQTGQEILVDDKDYLLLKQFKWQVTSGYALSWMFGKFQYMHVYLCPHKKGEVTDHRDRNKLNNQRNNLRAVTKSKDRINRGIFKNCELKQTGVRQRKDSGSYSATFKGIHLGTFRTFKEAKKIYESVKSYFI
jgi:hypothetical protein